MQNCACMASLINRLISLCSTFGTIHRGIPTLDKRRSDSAAVQLALLSMTMMVKWSFHLPLMLHHHQSHRSYQFHSLMGSVWSPQSLRICTFYWFFPYRKLRISLVDPCAMNGNAKCDVKIETIFIKKFMIKYTPKWMRISLWANVWWNTNIERMLHLLIERFVWNWFYWFAVWRIANLVSMQTHKMTLKYVSISCHYTGQTLMNENTQHTIYNNNT